MLKRFKIPKLAQVFLILFGFYFGFILLFDVILQQIIPKSLLTMYMFFISAGVFMVFTFTEESVEELVAPIKALAEDPDNKNQRLAALLIAPLLVGTFVFFKIQPSLEAPVELRSIHPAPPSSFRAFDKKFDLTKLNNPFRKWQKEDPDKFRELVAEGAKIYVTNCHFCHGDKLDGRGHYAAGLNPLPANFQDIGTIAQLQESYLFWRISTGGPGLPKEAAPWNSSMPVWQNYLAEDEIWKVILYLYDYTGHSPRQWENE